MINPRATPAAMPLAFVAVRRLHARDFLSSFFTQYRCFAA
jgi:hypothetical protein